MLIPWSLRESCIALIAGVSLGVSRETQCRKMLFGRYLQRYVCGLLNRRMLSKITPPGRRARMRLGWGFHDVHCAGARGIDTAADHGALSVRPLQRIPVVMPLDLHPVLAAVDTLDSPPDHAVVGPALVVGAADRPLLDDFLISLFPTSDVRLRYGSSQSSRNRWLSAPKGGEGGGTVGNMSISKEYMVEFGPGTAHGRPLGHCGGVRVGGACGGCAQVAIQNAFMSLRNSHSDRVMGGRV